MSLLRSRSCSLPAWVRGGRVSEKGTEQEPEATWRKRERETEERCIEAEVGRGARRIERDREKEKEQRRMIKTTCVYCIMGRDRPWSRVERDRWARAALLCISYMYVMYDALCERGRGHGTFR